MGTSSPYNRPNRKPLLPPWADEEEPFDRGRDGSPNDDNERQPDDILPQQPLLNSHALNLARNNLLQHQSGNSEGIRSAVSQQIRARGGATQANRANRAGRTATVALGGFLSSVARQGVARTLESFGFSHLIGESIDVVINAIVELTTSNGSLIDQAMVRHASLDTLAELYNRYELASGIENLDALDAQGVREALVLSISDQIFHRCLLDIQSEVESGTIDEHQAIRVEREVKECIREMVILDLSSVDVLTVNWAGTEGKKFTWELYQQAYSLLENRP